MNPWLGSRASWCISWNTERCVMCSEAVCLVLLSAPLIFHTHCHPLLTVSVLASYWYITSQRKARPADVFCYSLSSTSCTSISFHHHFSSVGCRVGSFNSNKEQRKKVSTLTLTSSHFFSSLYSFSHFYISLSFSSVSPKAHLGITRTDFALWVWGVSVV